MGFIVSSSTVQLYAYFTEYARERIFNGDVIDFQIKNFSLHDEDINYQISKQIIGVDSSGNTLYNTPKSGFIPDITGDNDVCIKSNKGMVVFGKNMLKGEGNSPMSANFSQNCSTFDYVVIINVTNPVGGSGGPYTWRVAPVFPNGTPQVTINQFYTDFGPDNYFTPKQIGQSFEFSTRDTQQVIPIYYQVYVKDGQGTEKLIGQTNLDCLPNQPQNNLIFNQTNTFDNTIPTNPASVAVVGGNKQTITLDPSYYNYIDVSIRNSDNSQITQNTLNTAFFKIEKSNLTDSAWNYIDLVIGVDNPPYSETVITSNLRFEFNNNTNGTVTPTANNTIYKKSVPIKVIRKDVARTKPPGSTSTIPNSAQGNILFRVYSDFINPSYSSDITLEYRFHYWT